jgi:hypothetical protein
MPYPTPEMVSCECLWCKNPFQARKADVNRGWGKFCSKKCKAINQVSPGGRGRLKQAVKNPNPQKSSKSHLGPTSAPKSDLPRDESFSDYDLLCAAEDAQKTAGKAIRHAYR